MKLPGRRRLTIGLIFLCTAALAPGLLAPETVPRFEKLLAHPVALKPELQGVHPRVFVTSAGLEKLRQRARTTHRAEWGRVLQNLVASKGAPPPVPGPQERRSQNNAAFAIAEISLAFAVERKPEYLAAAKEWTLAAIDYEPWGYTFNKPNVDLAAGHLLYAIGWAYDLLYTEWSPAERDRIRASLERHAALVHDHFAPGLRKRFQFTQNHDFIPTAGLGIAALALLGESKDAPKWAALARAHHHRAGQLLSPDGHYYEGFEYWIFSAPWLVHFLDGWEHATGESLWNRDLFANWKLYLAHALLPDGQNVFDFGDIWEGALTRARTGAEYPRVYPGGRLQSNFNVMYRVASRLRDPAAQAIAERYASFGHSNLEEYWTLLWRDETLPATPMSALPLSHRFADSGVFYYRTSWDKNALAFAFKAGPPEGHRTAALLPRVPEWALDSGHAHPDAGSFIVYAHGTYLTGDSGYAGLPSARNHNTLTFEGVGQGTPGHHDVWRGTSYAALDTIRIREVKRDGDAVRIEADLKGAYPQVPGLRSLVRTLRFDGRGFSISDHLALETPTKVEWHLQSDTPFVSGTGGRYRNGVAGSPALEVAFEGSAGTVKSEPSKVKSPGPPGSIEKGPEEGRGFVLVREALVPAGETQLSATLTIVEKRR